MKLRMRTSTLRSRCEGVFTSLRHPRHLARWATSEPVMPRSRAARLLCTVLLGLIAAGSATVTAFDWINAVPQGAAFTVGGTVVTIPQLDDRMRLLSVLYGVQAPTEPSQLDRFHRDSAKAVAVTDVLDTAAAQQGIAIADKAANDQLTEMLHTSYPQGRDDFIAHLSQVGLSQQSVLDEVKRQMANGQLYDRITKNVPLPTDDEVTAAYNNRLDQMVTPERRHVRNIVVASQGDAQKVRTQLGGGGADFTTIAHDVSLDKPTVQQGGDLGTVTRDQLEKNYGDAAFTAAANGLFGPVQTQHGWNIGQVLEITPSTPLTLDQVRAPLRERLYEERKSTAWDEWLGKQIAGADIHYAKEYEPADPNSPTSSTP
jgi:peptidyl-prolyl cis-trans isomerase C